MAKHSGNTLSEYAFILALISVLALGGLRLLGPSISQLLNQAGQKGANPVQNYMATTLPPTLQQSGASNQNQNGSQTGADSKQNGNNLLQLHTSGTSGTNATSVDGLSTVTEKAQALTNLVQDIQADPNHDPGVLALVTKLANTGHSASESMKGGITIYGMSIEAGGEILTMESSSIVNTINSGAAFKDQFQQLATYLDAHPNALSADQIQSVQVASNDITGILDQLGNSNGTKGNDLVNKNAWADMARKHMEVRQDSNTICRNGGQISQCVQ